MATCHLDNAGNNSSKKPGGSANLEAGEQLLSSVLINLEEEAHVVIAIPQDDSLDATDHMQQGSEQAPNQLTQSDANQGSDHADSLRLGVQSPPDADGGRGGLQAEEEDNPQVPSDHVSVLHKGGAHQQGRKTVFITVSPQGSIRITSSNLQFTMRPEFSNKGE